MFTLKKNIYRNSVFPAKLFIAYIKDPTRIRFVKTESLFLKSRVILCAFILRLGILISVLVFLAYGYKLKYYLIFSGLLFLFGNLAAGINLFVNVELRNLISKSVFKSNERNSIMHILTIGRIATLFPAWILSNNYMYTIIVIQTSIEFYFAKRSTNFSVKMIVVLFVITKIALSLIYISRNKILGR